MPPYILVVPLGLIFQSVVASLPVNKMNIFIKKKNYLSPIKMKLTLDQALKKGVEAQKAGKVQDADRYYTAILKAKPEHPDANHNMGLLAVSIDKVEEALPFFTTALEANPNIVQFWLSYIDALIKLNKMADAKVVIDKAKSIGAKGDGIDRLEKRINSNVFKNPIGRGTSQEQLNSLIKLYNQNRFQQVLNKGQKLTKRYTKNLTLWNLMGASAAQLGQLDNAVAAFKKAISIKPDYAEAHHNMGNALREQGKLDEATRFYKKAFSIKPDYAEAHLNIGNVFKDQGKIEEAIEAYKKALSIRHDYAEAFNNMGNALHVQGKVDEAIEAYNNVLSIKPDYAEAHNNIGTVFQDQGKIKEAIEAYSKAVSIKQDYAEAFNNMGNALHMHGRFEEAVKNFNQALSIAPDYAEAYLNKGAALHDQGNLEEAIETYHKALSKMPNNPEIQYNTSFVKLQTEEWKDGIELQKWRWKNKKFQVYQRFFEAPEWDGESPIGGKTLLVWGEQGPGDIIIWCACLNYYASICSSVIVECPQKLVKLLTISFPKITVRAEKKDIEQVKEDFDFQIPIETLFGYACLSGKITNYQNEYIFPEQKRVKYWKNRLKLITEKPCIGISWKSPVMNIKRQNNYADLAFWKPLLKNQNFTFFNLQSSHFENDLQKISREFGVEVINFDDLDHYNDLAEVAAFCKALDKTISIATTVATISAAVGTHTIIPTWKQGSWNNILYNSRGPEIELLYRNTWEPWDNTFNEISRAIL